MKSFMDRSRAAIAACLAVLQLTGLLAPVAGYAQGRASTGVVAANAASPVDKGRDFYEQSRFDEAITYLRNLISQNTLTGQELQTAREYLARSLVKAGRNDDARDMFRTMLQSDPRYRPDAIRVPPDETAVFDEALKAFTTPAPTTPQATTTEPAPPAKPEKKKKKEKAIAPVPAATIMPATGGAKSGSILGKWYLWAGLAAVAGGVAAAGGGGSKGGGSTPASPLPGFPAPPTP